MLNYPKDSRSLIEKARDADNGPLLQHVIDLERARLREHGAKEGLDKFKLDIMAEFKLEESTWRKVLKYGPTLKHLDILSLLRRATL